MRRRGVGEEELAAVLQATNKRRPKDVCEEVRWGDRLSSEPERDSPRQSRWCPRGGGGGRRRTSHGASRARYRAPHEAA